MLERAVEKEDLGKDFAEDDKALFLRRWQPESRRGHNARAGLAGSETLLKKRDILYIYGCSAQIKSSTISSLSMKP